MRRRNLIGLATLAVLAASAGQPGCGPDARPATVAPEPARVWCDLCGRALPRQDAVVRVGIDGADTYICRSCPSPAHRRQSSSRAQVKGAVPPRGSP